MPTCALKLLQDQEIFQDVEGLVLNHAEIPVEIQYMNIFLGFEANITHSIS